MEILELLFASGEACGCFIQVLAAIIDISAGVHGYQVGKKIKQRRKAISQGETPPQRPVVWPFVVLVFLAVLLSGLAVFSLFGRSRP